MAGMKLTQAQLNAAIASVFGKTLTAATPKASGQSTGTRKIVKDQTTNLLARRARQRREESATVPVATVSLFRRQHCGCCDRDDWALEGEYVAYRNPQGTETRLSRETAPRSIAQDLPHEVLWENDSRQITMCAKCATLSSDVNDLITNLDLNAGEPEEQLELFL